MPIFMSVSVPREVHAGKTIVERMQLGKTLLVVGFVVMGIGAVLNWAPWLVTWFGRLPGDIRLERDGFRFYCPVTSMILVSIALSLLVRLFNKG